MRKISVRGGLIVGVKLTVTVVLFYLILREVEIRKFARVLDRIQLSYLLVPCLVYVVSLHIASVKLVWLLDGYKIPIRLRTAFDLNWIGGFFNNFLPSTVGGDLYRVLNLNRRYPRQPAQVVSAIVLDRGLGLLATVVVAALSSVLFIRDLILTPWVLALFYSSTAFLTLAGFFVLFAKHDWRLSHISRHTMVNRAINGINILVSYPEKKVLTRSLLISFIIVGLTIASNYFLFLAFNVDVSFWVLLFVIPIVNVAGMIPISINALGVTEGVGIVLFGHFGFEPELILSIFLTARILLILCSATGGVRFLFWRNAI
jgi:uncharacterized protein (TIRG00374 family)